MVKGDIEMEGKRRRETRVEEIGKQAGAELCQALAKLA